MLNKRVTVSCLLLVIGFFGVTLGLIKEVARRKILYKEISNQHYAKFYIYSSFWGPLKIQANELPQAILTNCLFHKSQAAILRLGLG